MDIGLIDVDGRHFPNLALMKLSAWHKSQGDTVTFASLGEYDLLYYSKVFTFTEDFDPGLASGAKSVYGGTGYKKYNKLPEEIEHIMPDYELYKCKHAYGFLTRGCIRKCSWCVVPDKEGPLVPHADIDEFIGDMDTAILMDNNVLASGHGLKQIEKIIDKKIKVDFNQGLDARIISDNPDIAKLLSRVKWLKPIRMACDTKAQMPAIEKAVSMLRDNGATPKTYFVYCLVKDIPDALERVLFLDKLKLDAFAQPYIDFDTGHTDIEQRRFARWVNMKAIHKTVKWEDYKKAPAMGA